MASYRYHRYGNRSYLSTPRRVRADQSGYTRKRNSRSNLHGIH